MSRDPRLLLARNLQKKIPDHLWRKGRRRGEQAYTRWLLVLTFDDERHRSGISEDGLWMCDTKDGLLAVRKGTYHLLFVYIEWSRAKLESKLIKGLDLNGLPLQIKETFPLDDVVEAATTGHGLYWTETAIDWMIESEWLPRDSLRLKLKDICRSKKYPQKIRQKANTLLSGSYLARQGDQAG